MLDDWYDVEPGDAIQGTMRMERCYMWRRHFRVRLSGTITFKNSSQAKVKLLCLLCIHTHTYFVVSIRCITVRLYRCISIYTHSPCFNFHTSFMICYNLLLLHQYRYRSFSIHTQVIQCTGIRYDARSTRQLYDI